MDQVKRRRAVRWVSWIAGLSVLVLFFALVDLSVPLFFQSRPEFYEGYLLSTGWGVLFTFFAGIPLCVLGWRPGSVSAALLPVAAAIAVLAAAIASAEPRHLLIVVGLLMPSAVAFFLADNVFAAVRASGNVHWPTLAISVIAVPIAAMFAAEMAMAARDGRNPVDYSWDFDHWPIQAAAALTVPLAGALLSFRLPGWRSMMFIVAAGTAWFGTASIVYPDHAGSLGSVSGWSFIIWAVGLAGLAFHRGVEPRSIRPGASTPGLS